MKRKRQRNRRIMAGTFFCAVTALFAACGAGNGAGQSVQTAKTGQAERAEEETETEQSAMTETSGDTSGEEADVSAEDVESAAASGQDGNANSETGENAAPTEMPEKLCQAKIRHYYGGILSQVMAVYQLPDMELGVGVWGKDTLDAGEMAENCFAVADVDQDGREELLVRWTTTTTAGSLEVVYDYNPVSGELKNEFCAYPLLTYYDNGVIKAGWSHNQVPPAEFWPCTFYQFEPEENSYVEIGSLRAWDDIGEEWDFPTERDVDGDGTVYEMVKAGEEYSDYDSDYEGFQFNQADVDEWLGGFMEGAQEIPLVYYPMKHESFADFTPAYLRMLAAEAGKERTDTASDLGLFILNEEYFLDAAQTLLSEKYGVVMEQPDPAFEEWTVGSKDGKELFSFEALNAGHIGYKGERFEDVTIFGIYPGMRVDSAWEKLQAYGFYASSYAEVENCLITGEGFGNISIWFSAEDNVVTDITVGPYCAFAG